MRQTQTRSVAGLFARFAAAGAVGTATHYCVLIALVELASVAPAAAAAAGAVVGATVNYLLNYHVTFRSRSSHVATFARFAVVALAGMILNAGIVFLFVRLGMHYLIGQFVATAVVLVVGFVANHLWTFAESIDERSHQP
jgi:putative flippase GtrA